MNEQISKTRNNKEYLQACESGDLITIKRLLFEVKNPIDLNYKMGSGLTLATENNHMHVVKYLLEENNPEYKNKTISSVRNIYSALQKSAKYGNLNICEYLFNQLHIAQKYKDENGSIGLDKIRYASKIADIGLQAIGNEKFLIVEFILNNPDISLNVDKQALIDSLFYESCGTGSNLMYDYIMTYSPSLEGFAKGFQVACKYGHMNLLEKVDINAINFESFKAGTFAAIQNQEKNVLKYLLNNTHHQMDFINEEYIKNVIKDPITLLKTDGLDCVKLLIIEVVKEINKNNFVDTPEIFNLIEKRELNEGLSSSLNDKQIKAKKLKI